jgi:hypothetical protein
VVAGGIDVINRLKYGETIEDVVSKGTVGGNLMARHPDYEGLGILFAAVSAGW